jgi:hypothetical protein
MSAARRGVLVTTLLWLAGVAFCLYLTFGNGMRAWAALDNAERVRELHRQSAYIGFWLAAVAVGGPLLAAAFAMAGRLRKTTVAYLVLAVLMVPPAALVARDAHRTLHPLVVRPTAPSTHCQEHSGGEASCPGG